MILAGDVAVNGVVVTELGARADTVRDMVTVKGQPCVINSTKLYIALHKPEGVVTTMSDPYNRPTVMDYLPENTHCYPVGRLDYDTSGLLLLTNDGEFCERITHPKHGVIKTYIATVKGIPTMESLDAFRTGLMIEDQLTSPCEIEIIKKEPNAKVRIKLHEGRNRQVRKMCEAISHPVLSLKRVEIGSVKLGALARGQWRHLSAAEIRGM